MLKLKLQYFVHLMRRVDSLEKILMLGGIGDRRRRGLQRMRWLDACWGPASAGSRGTLRMNGVGKKKRERETESDQMGGCSRVWQIFILFYFFLP